MLVLSISCDLVGSNAGEAIIEGVIAIEAALTSRKVASISHPHPSLSEAFKEAAMACTAKPIHF